MKLNGVNFARPLLQIGIIGLLLLLVQACGSAAEPTTSPTATTAPQPTAAPTAAQTTAAPTEQAMMPTEVPTALPTPTATPTGLEVKTGGVLNLPSVSNVLNLDPNKVGGWNYCEVCYGSVTESLVRLFQDEGADVGALKTQPYLAKSWEMVDPKTYIFHLQEGVHFHNVPPVGGREFTADDVVYSYNHMTQPDPEYGYKTILTSIDNEEAVDKYTVQVNLKTPTFAILRLLALADGSQIIPREVEETPGYDADKLVVGTGPYIFKEWIEGTSVHVERNPDYWRKGHPYLDEVNMLVMPDAAARLAAFRSDQVQILDMEWGQAQTIIDDPNFVVEKYPGNQQRGIGLQHRRPPFNDIRMRQAVQEALDLQAFVDILDDGQGKVNTGYWWSMTNLALDQSYVPHHDVEKAKQLMRDAGYDPDVGVDVDAPCRAGDPFQCRIQEIVQDQLAQIGIRTHIETLDRGTWREKVFTQYDFDIYSYSAPAHEVPERFHAIYVYGPSSNNAIGVADPDIDSAIEAALSATSQQEYEARWKDYEKIFLQKVPYVFLDTPYRYTAQQPYLEGFRNSVAGFNRFQYIADFWFNK